MADHGSAISFLPTFFALLRAAMSSSKAQGYKYTLAAIHNDTGYTAVGRSKNVVLYGTKYRTWQPGALQR